MSKNFKLVINWSGGKPGISAVGPALELKPKHFGCHRLEAINGHDAVLINVLASREPANSSNVIIDTMP
jgi:hypothetical protein